MDDDVVALVKDALAHLYDYPHLLNHPLADGLGLSRRLAQRERMRLLRATLVSAIEQLRPHDDAPLRSAKSRSYQVLNLHYVESMLMDEVARELAVSARQAYRDLHKAEEDLAAILGLSDASQPPADPEREPDEVGTNELGNEAALVATSSASRALAEILAEVQEAVQALAASRGITFVRAPSRALQDRCCPAGELVRQALISLSSLAVKLATPGSNVKVKAGSVGGITQIVIRFEGDAAVHNGQIDTARKLLALVNGRIEVFEAEGQCTFEVTLPSAREVRVLLVDDNADLSEMFARFLKDTPYTLTIAQDAEEGLVRVSEGAVDIVILDVMMPGKDGWSLLQRLANGNATKHLPVIICSVIHDPELAVSLGAAASLAKPVNRSSLLTLLDALAPRHLQEG